MFPKRLAGLSILTICTLPVPASDMAGPILGLIPDARLGAVQPIRGIPGAASVGDPLSVGEDISDIAVAPRGNNAVLITEVGTRLAVVGADGTVTQAETGLPSEFHPAIVRFSPTGSSTAFYDPAAKQLWVKTDTARQLDTSQLPAAIDQLTVGDRPEAPIAGTMRGDSHSVFVMDAKGTIRMIAGFAGVTDVTFAGSSGDLLIADGSAKQVLRVRDVLSGNAPELLLALAGAPGKELRIASSGDGTVLAVLAALGVENRISEHAGKRDVRQAEQGGNPVLGLLRLADQQWSPVECGCTPVSLTPLRGNSVYRLTERTSEPLWLLDGDSGAARVLFVPAVQK